MSFFGSIKNSFSKAVAAFGILSSRKMNRVRQEASIQMFGQVIEDTPVDTGLLVNNWQLGVNTVPTEKIDSVDPTRQLAFNRIALAVRSSKMTDELNFVNNADHFVPIEFDGHSQGKAPFGMLRINLAQWDEIVAEINNRGF